MLVARVLSYELAKCFHVELRGAAVTASSSALIALNVWSVRESV